MTILEAPPVEPANPPAASSRATKPPGITERLAVASARRPKRTLAIWGLVILVALVLIVDLAEGPDEHRLRGRRDAVQAGRGPLQPGDRTRSSRSDPDGCDRRQLGERNRRRRKLPELREPPDRRGANRSRHLAAWRPTSVQEAGSSPPIGTPR